MMCPSTQAGMMSLLAVFAVALRLTLTNSVVTKAIKTKLITLDNVHAFRLVWDSDTLCSWVWSLAKYTLKLSRFRFAHGLCVK